MISLSILLMIGALAGLVIVGVLVFLFYQSNKVDLTSPTDSKPEWMRQMPPAETISATLTDGEGVQTFNQDPGEKLASPFAEQIEDIVQVRLANHPSLSQYRVDFGSAPDGGLEIHVNGQTFTEIEALPNEALKALIREAIETWRTTD